MSYKGFYKVDLFDCPEFEMFTAEDCHRAVDILEGKSFEPMSMKIWCQLCKDATSIIDIGAHVGVYSLAAASLRKDIPIYAFEPNPYAYTRLWLHKNINKFNNIVIEPVALSYIQCISEIAWLNEGDKEKHVSSGASLARYKSHKLDMYGKALCYENTLDNYKLNIGNKGLIKIDVEGMEDLVLQGMKEVFFKYPTIILETFNQGACDLWNKAVDHFEYKVYKINEEKMRLEEQDKLYPADPRGGNKSFNQLITMEPFAD